MNTSAVTRSMGRPLPDHARQASTAGSDVILDPPSEWLLMGFTAYARRYIRRHFHSLRVSRSGSPPDTGGSPVVVYANHASWWDPLIGLVLKARFFPQHDARAPMDAGALKRYPIFRKLGFFGVERDARRGAVRFLRAAETVVRRKKGLLWITPQGRFADVRERPVTFQTGLGHVARHVECAIFLPMAMEYVFWEERLPEILVRFGEPMEVRRERGAAMDAEGWTRTFEEQLQETQDALSAEARGRDPQSFEVLLRGGGGQGGLYDVWRALMSWLRGEPFRKEHGVR